MTNKLETAVDKVDLMKNKVEAFSDLLDGLSST